MAATAKGVRSANTFVEGAAVTAKGVGKDFASAATAKGEAEDSASALRRRARLQIVVREGAHDQRHAWSCGVEFFQRRP